MAWGVRLLGLTGASGARALAAAPPDMRTAVPRDLSTLSKADPLQVPASLSLNWQQRGPFSTSASVQAPLQEPFTPPTRKYPPDSVMYQQLVNQGVDPVYNPETVIPSTDQTDQASIAQTGGRDDQQSDTNGSEAHSHIIHFLTVAKELHSRVEWGETGTYWHLGGGTVPFYDVWKRYPRDEHGQLLPPLQALAHKIRLASAPVAILNRNFCGSNMEDLDLDTILRYIRDNIDAGVKIIINFDANNRDYAHPHIAAETIKHGATYALAFSASQYPENPTVFNPYHMSKWYIRNVYNIQNQLKSDGIHMETQDLLKQIIFYIKDPSGGAFSPASAKIFAEVLKQELGKEFGEEHVKVALQMHDCQKDALAAYCEFVKVLPCAVETSAQFQNGGGQPGSGFVHAALQQDGIQTYPHWPTLDACLELAEKFRKDYYNRIDINATQDHNTWRHNMAGGGSSILRSQLEKMGKSGKLPEVKKHTALTRQAQGGTTPVTPFENANSNQALKKVLNETDLFPGYQTAMTKWGETPEPQDPVILKQALVQGSRNNIKKMIRDRHLSEEFTSRLDSADLSLESFCEKVVDVGLQYTDLIRLALRKKQLESRLDDINKLSGNESHRDYYDRMMTLTTDGKCVTLDDQRKLDEQELAQVKEELDGSTLPEDFQTEYRAFLLGNLDDFNGLMENPELVGLQETLNLTNDDMIAIVKASLKVYFVMEGELKPPGRQIAQEMINRIDEKLALGLKEDPNYKQFVRTASYFLNYPDIIEAWLKGRIEPWNDPVLYDGQPTCPKPDFSKPKSDTPLKYTPTRVRVFNLITQKAFDDLNRLNKQIHDIETRLSHYDQHPDIPVSPFALTAQQSKLVELKRSKTTLSKSITSTLCQYIESGNHLAEPTPIPTLNSTKTYVVHDFKTGEEFDIASAAFKYLAQHFFREGRVTSPPKKKIKETGKARTAEEIRESFSK